jgi:hypothetical protein
MPELATLPRVRGDALEGATLTVEDATWQGFEGEPIQRRWEYSDDNGAHWHELVDNADSYTLTATDVGMRIHVAEKAEVAGLPAVSPMTEPVEAADPDLRISLATVGLIVVAAVIAIVVGGRLGHAHAAFQVDLANFALFAAFYAAAAALERLLEPFARLLPFIHGSAARRKSSRALLMLGIGTLVAVGACMLFGLYFMAAIGVNAEGPWMRGVDLFVTALIIAGGTKPLHDFIGFVQAKKDATAP